MSTRTIKITTPEEYLGISPINQVVDPEMSSWGYWEYGETWLMGKNDWIYPEIYRAIDELDHITDITQTDHSESTVRALNQYLRELLLAQSSDWAFIMHSQPPQSYGERRVREHIENMETIAWQVNNSCIDLEWVKSIKCKHNLFSDIDLLAIWKCV